MQVVSGGLNRMNEVGTNYSLTPSRSTENEAWRSTKSDDCDDFLIFHKKS